MELLKHKSSTSNFLQESHKLNQDILEMYSENAITTIVTSFLQCLNNQQAIFG